MPQTQVFIGRLPYNVEEGDVEHFFKGYGRIESISLKTGFGFVIFENSRDAKDAVKDLNRQKLLGERIVVDFARGNPYPDEEGGGRGRGGGGGGGGYRGDRGGDRGGYGGGRGRSRSPPPFRKRSYSRSRSPSPRRRSPSPRRYRRD